MSTTSGTPWRWWLAPGGHCQKASSQKRVAPTTRSDPSGPAPRRTVTKATCACADTLASASRT